MPNTRSAIKAARQNLRRRMRNRAVKSATRTYIKKARQAIESGDVQAAEAAVRRAVSALDKAAEKGIIHKNNAARRKSRLMKKFQQMLAAS